MSDSVTKPVLLELPVDLAREAKADEVLAAAGIFPGDPSLYPRTLDDVFPHSRAVPAE